MHWLSPFFYMEAEFGHQGGKKDKTTTDINRDEILSEEQLFLTTNELKNFGRDENGNYKDTNQTGYDM
jgi:hypothetical protein